MCCCCYIPNASRSPRGQPTDNQLPCYPSTLQRYSDMHFSLDSELVPVFSNQVSYMTHLPNPAELLVSNIDVSKEFSLVVHGTPLKVLQYFTGKFMRLGAPVRCQQAHPSMAAGKSCSSNAECGANYHCSIAGTCEINPPFIPPY